MKELHYFKRSGNPEITVAFLKDNNYRIPKDNSDDCRAKGEDILAFSKTILSNIYNYKQYKEDGKLLCPYSFSYPAPMVKK